MALERAFARAGGLLLAGTDPTGGGGVIPGYSNQRMLELLVEAGFTPLEAIRIGTLDGATYLGRAGRIGSLEAGKQADLVLVTGDPSADIGCKRRASARRDGRERRLADTPRPGGVRDGLDQWVVETGGHVRQDEGHHGHGGDVLA